MIYGILFEIAVMCYLTYFVFWLLDITLPKYGFSAISLSFSYPTILLVISAAIMMMLDESMELGIKLIYVGIALLWVIAGRTTAYPHKTGKQLFFRFVLQAICFFGAWLIIERFYLA